MSENSLAFQTLAARFADDAVCMRGGRIVAHGVVSSTLTDATIQAVFGVRARHGDGLILELGGLS